MTELDHPNVLKLIGVSVNPEDATLHIVMPFMHYGDVRSFLKNKRGNVIELDQFPKVIKLLRTYIHTYMCVCVYVTEFAKNQPNCYLRM